MPSFIHLALAGSLALGGCMVAADPDADVFGHQWTITIASTTVAQTEPNGTLWDVDNSPPDPYAKVFFNDTQVSTTTVVSDSYTGTWDDVLPPFTINRGDKLRVEEYDSDTFGDGDLILICPGQDVEILADELRAGEIQCTDAGSMMLVELDEVAEPV